MVRRLAPDQQERLELEAVTVSTLLLIAEDGYGKRLRVDETGRTDRNRQGVHVAKVP